MLDEGVGGGGGGFEMKLQADRGSDLVGLIRAGAAAGQMDRAGRQIEGFAMPMENFGRIEKAEGGSIGVREAGDGVPADFPFLIGKYARSKGAGKKLGAQANAEKRLAGCVETTDEVLFRRQPRKRRFVVRAHGAAHNDESIDPGGIGQTGICEESGMANVAADAPERGFEGTETLERNMLENLDKHRAGGWLSGLSKKLL